MATPASPISRATRRESSRAASPASSQTAATDDRLNRVAATAKAAGDPLRARILRALRQESFSVGELCRVFETAQPAMSHHLKILAQAGLVTRRREANVVFYRRQTFAIDNAEERTHELRVALFDSLDGAPLEQSIEANIEAVHDARRTTSEQFFRENAHQFDDQQALVSEPGTYAPTVLAILESAVADRRHALEVGPGNGELLAAIAPLFKQVTAIDSTQSMLDRARGAVDTLANVHLKVGDFDRVPAVRKYNAVIASMVLHHMPSPKRFFQHAHSVLKKAGVLVIADLCSHDQEWVRDACGDLWLGFDVADLDTWSASSGFTPHSSEYLAQTNGFQIQIVSYRLAAC